MRPLSKVTMAGVLCLAAAAPAAAGNDDRDETYRYTPGLQGSINGAIGTINNAVNNAVNNAAANANAAAAAAANAAKANALSRHQPSKRGAETISAKSRAQLSYDSGKPTAKKRGSGQSANLVVGSVGTAAVVEAVSGVENKVGFTCDPGKVWAVVEGMIQCAERMSGMQEGIKAITEHGKVLYVRAKLVDGYSTGRVMRVTGDSMQMRVDMFGLDGRLTSSCYLTQARNTCHLGSPNNAHRELHQVPMFASTGGTLRHASELVGGNMKFAGSRNGGSMQDAYIASVTVSASQLTVHYAGLHHLNGSQGADKLRPVYGVGQINWSDLGAMMGSSANATWTMGSAWNANIQ